VEFYISRFQNEVRDHFITWLQRGGRYEPMIRARLRAAGLPEDMAYLALIESGYNPHAYSDAAAVGMWQFMTSTARGMGLRVNWWVDERRDPVRSTDAAVRFLAGLNEQFGSLYLAAAAYNGGPGRVARGLTRYADELEGQTGDHAFFALAQKDYLRAETKDYVPKLIAAALVAKDPTRYGFTITYEPELAYDTVRVGPLTPLAAVARAARATVAQIMDLNPHLLRGLTPPRDSFTVRVPVGGAQGFDSLFAALPVSERRAYTHTLTRKGEMLASLASRAGISARQLSWYNPDLKPNRRGRLPVGSPVLIPTPNVVAAARDVPDPAIERYGTTPSRTTHVVKRGESLGSIARKYETSVAALKRLNRLRKGVIFPGQVIVVRGTRAREHEGSVLARRRGSVNRTSDARRMKDAPRFPPAAKVHVVRRGESLESIARKYETSAEALKELNGLNGGEIRTGQKLIIKG
jgi:membrane-bound lytic murein transglycosylase D